MADCGLPRPLLEAWLGGSASDGDSARVETHLSSCEECRSFLDEAPLGVGLLLLADPGGAGPSEGFAGRVMDRVRAAGEPARPRAGVDDDAPPPPTVPPRSSPPRGRLLGLPRPAWAGVAAALAAGVAWMVLLRDPGTTVVPPDPSDHVIEKGRGSVVARDGGVLRWTGPFDGSLAGSVWVAKDAAVPTYAGELLHSPASSSFLARLPEGGRLDAGPSSWLAFGGPRAAALLEGGFTVSAPEGSPLELDTPSGRVLVPAGGEVEVSIGAAAGGSGPEWLGSWAAARRDGVEPGRPVSPPPVAPQVVFARRGTVEVALSGGPVRNMMERTTLRVGQALILLQGKAFLSTGVDDDGPPDSSRWMDGLPVPPGSRFFQRPAKAAPKPETPPGGFGAASGPVRNTLERSPGDGSTPEERAYALSVYEGVGGVEAVAAAAKAVDDPAVEVRCAALRVLALTASADRPTALAALRKLARDGDAFVARFAILALKTLKDTDAIPVLRAIAVDDDAPPETPKRGVDDDAPPGRIVAKVYALDALVALGDRTLLKEGAALLPEASEDPVLYPVLRQFVYDAMEKLSRDELRAYYADPRPGVKAAALLALEDFDLAEEALKSDSEMVRLAGATVLLRSHHPSELEKVGTLKWSTPENRSVIVALAEGVLSSNPNIDAPEWLLEFAHEVLAGTGSSTSALDSAARIIDRGTPNAALLYTLANGTPQALAKVILSYRTGLPFHHLRGLLLSEDSDVRYAAWLSAVIWYRRNSASPEVPDLISIASTYDPKSRQEATILGALLMNAADALNSDQAMNALFSMAQSTNQDSRTAAAFALGSARNSPEECHQLLALTEDTAISVAERAAKAIAQLSKAKRWHGPPIQQLYPSPSSNPVVRTLIAVAAYQDGNQDARSSVVAELNQCNSRQRTTILNSFPLLEFRLPTLGSDLLSDPDPEVRIRALLSYDHSEDLTSIARTASLDPNLWVRIVGQALIAHPKDQDWRSQFLASASQVTSSPMVGPPLSEAITSAMSAEEVFFIVSQYAYQSVEDGTATLAVGSEGTRERYTMLTLAARGAAMRANALIQAESDEAKTATLIRTLESIYCRESFEIAATLLTNSSPSGDPAHSAAQDTYNRLLGFSIASRAVDFHSHHHLGYFTTLEALAHL